MIRRLALSLADAAATSLSLGCAIDAAPNANESDENVAIGESEEAARLSGDFVSIHRDLRKCAHPWCGGFFVAPLAGKTLRCADGKSATQCYVVDYELGTLRGARAPIDYAMSRDEGAVILNGRVVSGGKGKPGKFVVRSAWVAPLPSRATGTRYLVTGNGRERFWAQSFTAASRRAFNDFDFGAAPGDSDQWDAVIAAGHTKNGPIVAGTISKTKTLEASQFWLPIGKAPAATCDVVIDTRLGAVTKDLLWPSETDAPVEVFHRPSFGMATGAELRALVGAPADAVVEELSFDDVFDARTRQFEGMDAGQIENAKKFEALRSVLRANLGDLRVVRIGTVSIEVYVVGRSPCGDLVGVKSLVVET